MYNGWPQLNAAAIEGGAQLLEVPRLAPLREALGVKSAFASVCLICAYTAVISRACSHLRAKGVKTAIHVSAMDWRQWHKSPELVQ